MLVPVPDSAGGGMPEMVAWCSKCQRDVLKNSMTKETNERSAAYGKLVCQECYDGPYPEHGIPKIPPAKPNYYPNE